MDKFDLTLFKIGLKENVFDQLQVMNFIYGEIKLDRPQKDRLSLVWNVSSFNKLPTSAREQLIRLLVDLNEKETFSFLKSVHDIATEFAMCTLRSLFSKNGHFVASDGFGYATTFSSHTTPTDGVREIINWANWGIKLDDEVYRMAQKVLNAFLEKAPEKATAYECVVAKKAELMAHQEELNKSIYALMNESNSLDALLLELKENPHSHFAKGSDAHAKLEEVTSKLHELTLQLADTYHELGQAEVYELVEMHCFA